MTKRATLTTGDAALLFLVAMIWGCNFLVIKWGLASMPPLLFSALRFVSCAFPWIFLVPRPKASWPALVALGFVLGACVFGFLFVGIAAGVPPGLASLLMQAQVFFTSALAYLIAGERPQPYKVLAVTLGLGGIALVAGQGATTASGLGFGFVLCGALSWGAANLMLRRLPSGNMLGVMVWISLVPPVPLLALSVLQSGGAGVWAALGHVGWQGCVAVSYTALLSTIVGYGLWGTMLQRYETTTVAQFSLLVPVFGLLSTTLVYGERHTLAEGLAIGLVFLSLALSTYGHLLPAKLGRSRRADIANAPRTILDD